MGAIVEGRDGTLEMFRAWLIVREGDKRETGVREGVVKPPQMASPNCAAKGIKTSHDDRFDNGAVKRTLGLPPNVLRTSRNPYAAEL